MKMIDVLGRELGIDLVYKTNSRADAGKSMWTRPLEFNLVHGGTTYACLPHGPIGLRVISQLGAEVLVYMDGNLIIAAAVDKGVQYIERDGAGNLLVFAAPGDVSSPTAPSNIGFGSEAIHQLILPPPATVSSEQLPKVIPNQPNLLFVVARLAEDPEIVGSQPPRIEYELGFQMNTAAVHHNLLAANFRDMVVPALPPDPSDPLSLIPPDQPRTTFVCSCTSCKSTR